MAREHDTALSIECVTPDKWIHDAERHDCNVCSRNFGTFVRKHHCRACGEVICSRCARYHRVDVPLIGITSVRICVQCVMSVEPKRSSSNGRSTQDIEAIMAEGYSVEPEAPPVEEVSDGGEDWPLPPVLPYEDQRLDALRSYNILDTEPDTEYDAICELASQTLNCAVAAISFIDSTRQWFKASVGIAQAELPREVSFCAHVLDKTTVTVVLDTLTDRRYASNPLVNGGANIRFYASAPIRSKDGYVIGTIMALDTKPRTNVTPRVIEVLRHLATMSESLIENNRTEDNFINGVVELPPMIQTKKDTLTPEEIETNDQLEKNALVTQDKLLDRDVSSQAIFQANTQQQASRSIVTKGRDMTNMCMDLLTRVTDTQQLLASQQQAMLFTLNNHGNRIGDIEDTVRRIEENLISLKHQRVSAA